MASRLPPELGAHSGAVPGAARSALTPVSGAGSTRGFLAVGVLLILLLVAPIFLWAPAPAEAKPNHSAITHDGTPEIVAAIRAWGQFADITDGGVSAHPDIYLGPPGVAPGVAAGASGTAETLGATCRIRVVPGDLAHNRNLFRHEVGHCLGLDHSPDPLAIMAADTDDTHDFRPDDIRAIRAIYGRRPMPFRLHIVI